MKRQPALVLLVLLVATSTLRAQREDSLGGAKAPKPDMSLRRSDQYKRVHQVALRYILLDRTDEAESFLNDYAAAHPNDAETHYSLGALYARRGNTQKAIASLRRAVELGLPEERIIAGPRELFASLQREPFIRGLSDKYANIPLHGPLVGNVSDRSASFWVRTTKDSPVTIHVSESADLTDAVRSSTVRSTKRNDFTAVATIERLKPNTTYHYAVQIGDGDLFRSEHQHFRTFPKTGSAAKFTFAFGGGAGYVPENERMWDTIGEFDPLALLLLGDNVYIDDPESETMQRYTYHRRQSRPEWRRLSASRGVFTIWDDHDFSTNDSWGGPFIKKPYWKREFSWPIYTQNWANPGYGGGDAQPGCWYAFTIGDVDFIMLDCRYYRTRPRGKNRSMLGSVQLEWLKQQLKTSKGTFKVVCSSVPWDFRTKGDSLDTWNGYPAEREAIFGFIEESRIEGVVLMSADRHRSDAWRIDRENGYGFFEFNSSRLTNQHVHPTTVNKGALFSYNKKQSFGLVTINTQSDDPTVTYDVITIDGDKVHSLTVRRSQLGYE